jgi:ATP-dependent RNA helicase RhlE
MSFHNLGLSKPLLDALAAKNYSQATPIQTQAIPTVLSGRDLLGIAQTGTGKTAAFMLPSLDRLAADRNIPRPGQIRMLVLAPTRELASQIAASAQTYGRFMHLSVGVIFGGVPNSKSVRTVARGLDVLVATPGRLLDLVDQRALSLRDLEILVLDEADQMLDLGFIHALKRIVSLIPPKRQTLFFSATMPRAIKELADRYLTNPAEVAVTPVAKTADRVQQKVVLVNQPEKTALLTIFLRSEEQIERTLVFSRTKHGADKIVRMLGAAGIEANAIHGNKSQGQRERILSSFRAGEVKVLVATDVAARGIDIPEVRHVYNYDLPNVPDNYVHRIGRTARAGRDGRAVAFCAPDEMSDLRAIEKTMKAVIPVVGGEAPIQLGPIAKRGPQRKAPGPQFEGKKRPARRPSRRPRRDQAA